MQISWKWPTKLQLGVKVPIPPQQGCSPRAIPHPNEPDAWESASSAVRQGRASAAPPARPCSNAALLGQGSELLLQSTAPGSSRMHWLILGGKASFPGTANPASPKPSLPLRTGAGWRASRGSCRALCSLDEYPELLQPKPLGRGLTPLILCQRTR